MAHLNPCECSMLDGLGLSVARQPLHSTPPSFQRSLARAPGLLSTRPRLVHTPDQDLALVLALFLRLQKLQAGSCLVLPVNMQCQAWTSFCYSCAVSQHHLPVFVLSLDRHLFPPAQSPDPGQVGAGEENLKPQQLHPASPSTPSPTPSIPEPQSQRQPHSSAQVQLDNRKPLD